MMRISSSLLILRKSGRVFSRSLFQKNASRPTFQKQIRSINTGNNKSSSNSSTSSFIIFGSISLGVIYSTITILANKSNEPDTVAVTSALNDANTQVTKIEEEEVNHQIDSNNNNETTTEEQVTQTIIDEDKKTVIVIENESQQQQQQEEPIQLTLPSYVPYLIIGGGTSAMAAFKSIRANDPKSKVLIVTNENWKPYMRPPLSKDMWFTKEDNLVSQLKFKQWNGDERSLFYMDEEFYVPDARQLMNPNIDGGVAVICGERAIKVDAELKKVTLESEWEINYDKLLIATGGHPKNLKCFDTPSMKNRVTLFRNIDDFLKLKEIAKQGKNIAIIGGGFLGSELAVALGNFSKTNGGSVMQILEEDGNLAKILPNYLSRWVTERVREENVNVLTNFKVEKALVDNDKVVITLDKNKNANDILPVVVDHVVVAVGISPNIELSSDLEIDPKLGGYLVNAELQARNSVWVAGDAACFYDVKLGRRRVEHHDHAVVTGRLAGENMTGAAKPYTHQSMFWSDLGSKIGFEAIGLIDSSLKTVSVFASSDEWSRSENAINKDQDEIKISQQSSVNSNQNSNDKYGKGIIFYLKDDRLVGILTWNLFKRMPIARKVLNEKFKVSDIEEVSRLFKINYDGNNANEI